MGKWGRNVPLEPAPAVGNDFAPRLLGPHRVGLRPLVRDPEGAVELFPGNWLYDRFDRADGLALDCAHPLAVNSGHFPPRLDARSPVCLRRLRPGSQASSFRLSTVAPLNF